MSEEIFDIKRWGNGLGVRLPAGVVRMANLHANQRVHITVDGNCVIIAPVQDAPLTLEQRLAVYDPQRHGGEKMSTTGDMGTELLFQTNFVGY